MTAALRPATTYAAVFGRVLLLVREGAGLTQAQVSDALGMRQTAVSRIEAGIMPVTMERLGQLSVILKTRPSEIAQHADAWKDKLEAQGIVVLLERRSTERADVVMIAPKSLSALVHGIRRA